MRREKAVRHGMTAGGWAERGFPFQMANVGSEISRTFRARASGKAERMVAARERCLALPFHTIDASIEETSPADARRAMRALEAFLEALDGEPGSLKERALDRHFLAWGLRANEEHAARAAAGEDR